MFGPDHEGEDEAPACGDDEPERQEARSKSAKRQDCEQ